MTGTGNRYFRIRAQPGLLKVRYGATVDIDPVPCDPTTVAEVPASLLPLDILTHLNPSRYVESDLLAEFARREFGNLPPGYGRVAAICDWIHRHLSYAPGSSDTQTSARDTLLQRRGVCRDYAHLAVAFCRALDIPARFVSAYACRLSPQDFHAVLEVWLEGPGGGTWFAFDPSHMASPHALVRIGTGRDASEAAFCTAFGDIGFGVPSVRIDAVDGGFD
jgi:transglutaminase-like putative cysteine protease